MKTEIIIVNELDKVIGHKERDSINSEDIYRVSALWITNSKGETLLAKRALTKSHGPGMWGPAVEGTVEKGETYYSNIIKESKEELGLTDLYTIRLDKERVKGKHNFFRQWHSVKLNKELKDFKVNKDEVAEIKWFSKEALIKELKKNPKKFLPCIKEMIE